MSAPLSDVARRLRLNVSAKLGDEASRVLGGLGFRAFRV